MKTILPLLPKQPQVFLFGREYPSYDLIHYLTHHDQSHQFVFRCPASSTFKMVEDFVKSGLQDVLIWLDMASHIKTKPSDTGQQISIKLRVVRLESPDGTLSVLIRNLLNCTVYTPRALMSFTFVAGE